MVLVSTAEKRKIYDYVLSEGVFCSKKDYCDHQLHETLGIKNLHCFLVMRSLLSRKFVTEVFSWQWHYYSLKPEGVKYLREYFGLPDTVVPNTHKTDRPEQKEEDEERPEGEQDENAERPRGGRGRGRGTRGRGGRGGRPRDEPRDQ